jgi:hypothetical protein
MDAASYVAAGAVPAPVHARGGIPTKRTAGQLASHRHVVPLAACYRTGQRQPGRFLALDALAGSTACCKLRRSPHSEVLTLIRRTHAIGQLIDHVRCRAAHRLT